MNVTFQPVQQQKGSVEGQWKCFCGCRQVGLDFSKIRTPSSISSTITDLDSNCSLSSLSQLKSVPGLSDLQKGSMRSVAAKGYNALLCVQTRSAHG